MRSAPAACRVVFFAPWLIYGATGASDGDGVLATLQVGVRLIPRPNSGCRHSRYPIRSSPSPQLPDGSQLLSKNAHAALPVLSPTNLYLSPLECLSGFLPCILLCLRGYSNLLAYCTHTHVTLPLFILIEVEHAGFALD
jgi:hypothetical protein